MNRNNKGLISVMMPVYNGMPYMKETIKSLLLQTYENWECVIVNDGSIDGTKEYINSLDDCRFIIHHFLVNKGRPQARQKAMELANGEFMAMLDADDLYHPKKLELQVKVMNANPNIYLVGTGMASYGKRVDYIRVRGKGDNSINTYNGEDQFPISHAPSLLRLDHAKKFSYNMALKLGQDIDFLRRYLLGKEYIIMTDVLYYYSEFDSVTIAKIRKTYKIYAVRFFKEGRFLKFILYILRVIYTLSIYPIIGLDSILKKRGIEPTVNEMREYRNTLDMISK